MSNPLTRKYFDTLAVKTFEGYKNFLLRPRSSRFDTHRLDRSEEHTSELQSHRDLHSFPTRRSSDLLTRKYFDTLAVKTFEGYKNFLMRPRSSRFDTHRLD